MILHRIHLKKATQEVTICPLGDIQWAGDEEDLAYDHLVEHMEVCLDSPTPLFVGMGDYIDFASPSNRMRLEQSQLYDTAKKVIRDATKGLVDDLYHRLLKPTKGKWAGLVEGHHHHQAVVGRLKDGSEVYQDSDVYLSKLLDARYLEEFGIVKLMFPGGGTFTMVVIHGSGNSVFPWGPLNKLYRIAPNFHADLLLMGHQTKIAKGGFDRVIFPDEGPDRLEHMNIKLVGTGGWTKGYVNGRRTYISQAALNPVTLGQPMIHLRPRFRKVAGRQVWTPGMTEES
jgi:hypothetical protein